MIRKTAASDAEWICELIASEIPNSAVTTEIVSAWIENGQVLVDDSEKSFIKWTKHSGYISADLMLTHPDYRSKGLSMTLFGYLWNISRKPVQFSVLKGSSQEEFGVDRDEYTKSRCTLLGEHTDQDGRVWRTYAARDRSW